MNLSLVRQLAASRIVVQSFSTYVLLLISRLFVLGRSKILVDQLGAADYGRFAFAVTFFTMLGLVFRFGFFSTVSYVISNTKDVEEIRQYSGAAMILAILCGCAMMVSLYLAIPVVESFYDYDLRNSFRILLPLCLVYPMRYALPMVGRGTNKMYLVSLSEFLPQLLFLGGLVAYTYTVPVTFESAFLIMSLAYGGAFIALIIVCRPRFDSLRDKLGRLWQVNKQYGIHLYFGQILDQPFARFDVMILGKLASPAVVGCYSLGLALLSPVSMLSRVIGAAFYRKMAELNMIPRKVTVANLGWLVFCFIGLVIAGRPVVEWLFGAVYPNLNNIVVFLFPAFFFQGLYQLPNHYLSVKGRKEIGYFSLITVVISLGLYYPLIKSFGIYGAIATYTINMATWYISFQWLYQRLKRKGVFC